MSLERANLAAFLPERLNSALTAAFPLMKFLTFVIFSRPQVFGGIAQLVERLVRNEKARGSNPLTSILSSA
jgi:hypothetical protein